MTASIYDHRGQERAQVKRCPDDRAVMVRQGQVLRCCECARTVEVTR